MAFFFVAQFDDFPLFFFFCLLDRTCFPLFNVFSPLYLVYADAAFLFLSFVFWCCSLISVASFCPPVRRQYIKGGILLTDRGDTPREFESH